MRSIRRAFRTASIVLSAIAVAAFPFQTLAAARVKGSFPIVDHFVDPEERRPAGFP